MSICTEHQILIISFRMEYECVIIIHSLKVHVSCSVCVCYTWINVSIQLYIQRCLGQIRASRISQRSIQALFSLFSIVCSPRKSNFISKSKLFLQSQQIGLWQSWLYNAHQDKKYKGTKSGLLPIPLEIHNHGIPRNTSNNIRAIHIGLANLRS